MAVIINGNSIVAVSFPAESRPYHREKDRRYSQCGNGSNLRRRACILMVIERNARAAADRNEERCFLASTRYALI